MCFLALRMGIRYVGFRENMIVLHLRHSGSGAIGHSTASCASSLGFWVWRSPEVNSLINAMRRDESLGIGIKHHLIQDFSSSCRRIPGLAEGIFSPFSRFI